MYEAFYGLAKRPFALGPDPSIFFKSRGHKRAIAYLRYGLSQREGLIVITGEIGTGKTLLVKTITGALRNADVVFGEIVNTQVGPDDLLQLVAEAFGLEAEGKSKAGLLRDLEQFLIRNAEQGKRVLLIVDEAQNLPNSSIEELRMLSNFERGGRALLQTFLLGQRELLSNTLLAEGMEQVRQRIIASYHLGPLDADETREYIEYRLACAGCEGSPELDPAIFERVHEYTGGVPRRINNFCDRLLLFGCLEERHLLDLSAVESVIEELNGELSTEGLGEIPVGAGLPADAPIDFAGARLEHRLVSLEQAISHLEGTIQVEMKRLRKAYDGDRSDSGDKAKG